MAKKFKTVQYEHKYDFEEEVEELLNDGWHLVSANSLSVNAGAHHHSQHTTHVFFHAFLVKDTDIVNPKS